MSTKRSFQFNASSPISVLSHAERAQRLTKQIKTDLPGLGIFVVNSCENTKDAEGFSLLMAQLNPAWLGWIEMDEENSLTEFFLSARPINFSKKATYQHSRFTSFDCTGDDGSDDIDAIADKKNIISLIKLETDLARPLGHFVERRSGIAPECLNTGLDLRLWRAFCDEEALGQMLFFHLDKVGLLKQIDKACEPVSFCESFSHAFATMRIYELYGRASLPFLFTKIDLVRVAQLSEIIDMSAPAYETSERLPSGYFLFNAVDRAMLSTINYVRDTMDPLGQKNNKPKSMHLFGMCQKAYDITTQSVLKKPALKKFARELNGFKSAVRLKKAKIGDFLSYLELYLGTNYEAAYNSVISPYKGQKDVPDAFSCPELRLWAQTDQMLYNQLDWNILRDKTHLTKLLAQQVLLQMGSKVAGVKGVQGMHMLTETINALVANNTEFAEDTRKYFTTLSQSILAGYTQPKKALAQARKSMEDKKRALLSELLDNTEAPKADVADEGGEPPELRHIAIKPQRH